MGRIRCIKPEFPQSETVGRLSRDARLLFIQLWTIVDDAGRTRAASRMLASLLYPYDTDVCDVIDTWLDELHAAGSIRRYVVGGTQYLDIPNWLKHQKIDRPTASRFPPFPEDSTNPRRVLDEPSTKDLGNGSGSGSGPGKGTEGEGIEEAVTPVVNKPRWNKPLAGDHQLRCPPGTYDACHRGICVPSFMADQWQKQLGEGEDAIGRLREFVRGVIAVLPDGPIGDHPLKFWQAAWSARHGSRVAAPAFDKGSRAFAAIEEALRPTTPTLKAVDGKVLRRG